MRTIVLLAGLVWMTGCATGKAGAPLGGQVLFDSYRYRPATPAAMPRAIPESDEASTPSRPALAEAPKREAPVAKSAPRVKRPEPKRRVETVSRPGVSRDARETVLATARALVGKSQLKAGGRAYPNDCTGLVEAAYAQAGLSLKGNAKPGDNGVTALYRYALNHGRVYNGGRPVPGDLVFFRETYDQNRDGRRNDGLTHVGIVDQVDADGTVTVIHRVKRGVVRYRMNLAKPRVGKDPSSGKILNDTLRAPGSTKAFALTGQLFAAYANVLPSSKPVVVAQR
jgi:cell wall-associated NlpC family hydrolase